MSYSVLHVESLSRPDLERKERQDVSEDLERCPVRCKYGPSVSVLGVDTFNLDGVAQFPGK